MCYLNFLSREYFMINGSPGARLYHLRVVSPLTLITPPLVPGSIFDRFGLLM